MVRPTRKRMIEGLPPIAVFKPMGIPQRDLEEVVLSVEEYELIRLADHEGLYQEQIAERMGISRSWAGQTLKAARSKVASALVHGKALRIEGGAYEVCGVRHFGCQDCGREWTEPFGTGRPDACPKCGGARFRRTDHETKGGEGGRCRRHRRGR